VRAQAAHARGRRRIVGGDEAGVAERVEILERMGREAAEVPERAALAPLEHRSDRLGGVLDNEHPVTLGDVHNPVHAADAAGEMHRHDRARARRHRALDRRRIDVLIGQHVDEHRARAEVDDHRGRGDERIRRRDHLVAGTDARHFEREKQRVGAGVERDRLAGAAVFGQPRLEPFDLRAGTDERAAAHDLFEDRGKLGHLLVGLCRQVHVGDVVARHGG
jgi:hypothetical protein